MEAEGSSKLQELQIAPWRSLHPFTEYVEILDPTVAAVMPKGRQHNTHPPKTHSILWAQLSPAPHLAAQRSCSTSWKSALSSAHTF